VQKFIKNKSSIWSEPLPTPIVFAGT